MISYDEVRTIKNFEKKYGWYRDLEKLVKQYRGNIPKAISIVDEYLNAKLKYLLGEKKFWGLRMIRTNWPVGVFIAYCNNVPTYNRYIRIFQNNIGQVITRPNDLQDLLELLVKKNFVPLDCIKLKRSATTTVRKLNKALRENKIDDLRFASAQHGTMFELYWMINGTWHLHCKSPILYDIITDTEFYFSRYRYGEFLSLVAATRSIQ